MQNGIEIDVPVDLVVVRVKLKLSEATILFRFESDKAMFLVLIIDYTSQTSSSGSLFPVFNHHVTYH